MTVASQVRQSPSGPIEDLPGGKGAVDSVFGRTGTVVAASGDYAASQVANDSGVGGANVGDALDALDFDILALQAAFAALDSDDVANASGVGGATVSAALDALLAQIAAGVTSVYGRTGAVIAAVGDYAASQVTNDSAVAGAHVSDALNALAGAVTSLAATVSGLVTGVSSVYGRAGAVVAKASDYDASQIDNDSAVAGAFVSNALNTLNSAIGALVTGVSSVYGRTGAVVAKASDYDASQVDNDSAVAGAFVSNALNTLNTAIGALVTGVSSVYGRTGAVVAKASDYDASQVDNDSAVSGAFVSNALNTLNNRAMFHFGAVASGATTTNKFFLRTFGVLGTTEANGAITAGVACTLTSIRVSASAASATDTITLTLRINGVDTAITCTIATNATSASATGFTVAVAAGDRLTMASKQSGTDTVSTWNADVVVY